MKTKLFCEFVSLIKTSELSVGAVIEVLEEIKAYIISASVALKGEESEEKTAD